MWGAVGKEGRGEKLGSDPAPAVEQSEVHYPCIGKDGVWAGLDACAYSRGQVGQGWESFVFRILMGKEVGVMLKSGGSEERRVVKSSEEILRSGWQVYRGSSGD